MIRSLVRKTEETEAGFKTLENREMNFGSVLKEIGCELSVTFHRYRDGLVGFCSNYCR